MTVQQPLIPRAGDILWSRRVFIYSSRAMRLILASDKRPSMLKLWIIQLCHIITIIGETQKELNLLCVVDIN